MRVKHLLRELAKCDPESEVIAPNSYKTWAIEEQPNGTVEMFAADPDPNAPEYDNTTDTPRPMPWRSPTA